MLSLFAMTLVLRTGRTIILHGVVLLVIFAVYSLPDRRAVTTRDVIDRG